MHFPLKSEKEGDLWYDVDDHRKIERVGIETVPVNAYKIPVYQRGGTIIPKKERIRRASPLMHDDPYTLIVAVDKNKKAKGTLYIDDEKSFEYRKGQYLYLEFEFTDNVLSSKWVEIIEVKNKLYNFPIINRFIDDSATYATKTWLERVVIVGLDKIPKEATLHTSNGQSTKLEIIEKNSNSFVVRKPAVSMLDRWSITLNY